jgi:hypothetical protein
LKSHGLHFLEEEIYIHSKCKFKTNPEYENFNVQNNIYYYLINTRQTTIIVDNVLICIRMSE